MDLTKLTIQKANEGLKSREFSATELTRALLGEIEGRDKELGAYLEVNRDEALAEARKADELISGGDPVHYLTGIPLAIKDNILIKGRQATAGSKILEKYTAAYDATVIKNLKKEEAIFLGKTNLDEFAMGSSTENSAYQTTRNPHNPERVPGGSSGGSAVAVAANMALGGLGSDTGGSIRQPAAFCGVVGLKPTYGAVSRYGLIALASSLDQIGTFTKTVSDAVILFRGISGHDEMDSTSTPDIDYSELLVFDENRIKNLTIGIPKEYFVKGLSDEAARGVEEAIETLKKSGFKFKEISLPHTKYALSVYYIIMPAEASTNLARYDGIRYGSRSEAESLLELYLKNRGRGFGPETKRRIILGTFVLSAGYYDAYYTKAQKVRTLIKQDFDKAFHEVDVIFAPVTPTLPFKIGEKTEDPLEMYLSDIFTIPVNLAGLPAVSLPVRGREGKLPIGFQLIGRPFREADILGIGQVYESA
ncbi:MAG: Asp-tRNA(Asn)/Glu-tRNA(Gln) amidotransferase subunit GatA [Candidatus Colwellbacteria bacterium]|nr:Asp-tRNA(Asn)/Glu-tRNA(Gln) amidotransferase subunit GatA [Candidatus Colwellbacteria bacterium]